MKRVGKIIRDIICLLLTFFVVIMIYLVSSENNLIINGYQIVPVLSHKMTPAIQEKTCVLVKAVPEEQLKIGAIAVFKSQKPESEDTYNICRIVDMVKEEVEETKEKIGETRKEETGEIKEEEFQMVYTVKGDQNPAFDVSTITYDKILGIYQKEIPGGKWIGKTLGLLEDRRIYFLVVVVPVALVFGLYFWGLMGMITKQYEKQEEKEKKDLPQ